MKMETDDNTFWMCLWTLASAVAIALIICIYKYNALPYEKGYVQEHIQNTRFTYWTKPQ